MGNFYIDVIQKSPAYNSAAPCRDTALLEPGTRAKVAALIADAASHGIHFQTTETFRSQAHQEQLFAQGATQLDGKSPETIGVHHFGLACDLVRVNGSTADWNHADYLCLQTLCAAHGLIWGGDWGDPAKLSIPDEFHDWDHVQNCTVDQQDDLFAGRWYPATPEVTS